MPIDTKEKLKSVRDKVGKNYATSTSSACWAPTAATPSSTMPYLNDSSR